MPALDTASARHHLDDDGATVRVGEHVFERVRHLIEPFAAYQLVIDAAPDTGCDDHRDRRSTVRVTKETVYATLSIGLAAMATYNTRQTIRQAAESARREADLHQHLAELYAELAQADFNHADDETARKNAANCLKMADTQTKAHDLLVEHAVELDQLATLMPFRRRRPRA